jgi:hypothetical protein
MYVGNFRDITLPTARAAAAALWLLLGVAAAAAGAAEIHGENSSFAGQGVVLVWGILKAPDEEQSQVLVRIVPADPAAYAGLRVEGVDPFTGARREILPAGPLDQGVELRERRGGFAEYTRREFHFFKGSGRPAARPTLTIYFLGVPDTTPEFLAEGPLAAYLDEAIAKLKGRAGQAP